MKWRCENSAAFYYYSLVDLLDPVVGGDGEGLADSHDGQGHGLGHVHTEHGVSRRPHQILHVPANSTKPHEWKHFLK